MFSANDVYTTPKVYALYNNNNNFIPFEIPAVVVYNMYIGNIIQNEWINCQLFYSQISVGEVFYRWGGSKNRVFYF